MTTVIPHGGTRMTRWKVRRERGMFWDEDDELCDGPRWHVTSPTGVLWGNYATHTEAMSRADRQARTITVTLPRETPRDFELTLSKRDRWDKYVTIKVMKPGETTTLEELALALLAHARKEKQ